MLKSVPLVESGRAEMSLPEPGNPGQERTPRREMENRAAGTVLLPCSTLAHTHGKHRATPVSAPQRGWARGRRDRKRQLDG